MKRIVCAILAAVLLVCLCACGETVDVNPKVSPLASPSPEATEKVKGGEGHMGNPWQEVTADALESLFGRGFGIPTGASDISYQWNETSGLLQMQFTLNGIHWTARMKQSEKPEDISGMCYEWNEEVAAEQISYAGLSREFTLISPDESVKISGELHYLETDEGMAVLGLWYYSEGKLMFSLSTVAEGVSGEVKLAKETPGILFFPDQSAASSKSGNQGKGHGASPSPSATAASTPAPTAVPTSVPTAQPTETPHEHSWVLKEETAATCTEAGMRVYACACGATDCEDIPPLEHDYQVTQHIDADCLDDEGDIYTCSRCGLQMYKATPGGEKATGHTLGWKPADGEAGEVYHIRYCTVCGEEFPDIWELHSGSPCICGHTGPVG